MFTTLKTYIHRKISDAVDTGKPLPFYMQWFVKNDKSTRDFYENLLRMEKRFTDELPQFLSGDPKIRIPGKYAHPSNKTVVWNKLTVAVTLLLGLSIFSLLAFKNTENNESVAVVHVKEHDKLGQVNHEAMYRKENLYMVVEPLRESIRPVPHSIETVVPDSLKIVQIDWDKSELKLNPTTIESITVQSKEMLNQLPLVESAFAFAAKVNSELRDIR